MPTVLLKDGKQVGTITLIKGNLRIEVKAKDVWAAFADRAFTMPCIKCDTRGGQCTKNYGAGCKGNR